ncbi:MAG: hypothetical protein CSA32_01765 [Desulfobulbus propionicus]|nr:MAG: hypothetical protein CSA32_01765 [Desulfobulbus propionicus]
MKHCALLFSQDDEQIQLVKSALSGYRLVCCRSEREVQAGCDRYAVCLVLLVHDPPRTDAGQLFAELREKNPGLAGVALAPAITRETLQAARDVGISTVLEVPLQPDQVRKAVQNTFYREALQDENSRLRTLIPLYRLGEKFLSSTSEKEIVDGLLESVSDVTGATNISILLYQEECSCLRIAASRGLDRKLAETICIQPGESISGWVFQQGKPVILNRETQEKSIFWRYLKRPEVVSAISCPMIVRDKILGVLNISQTDTDERFSRSDMEMISVVCTQAALALENVRSLEKIRKSTRLQTLLQQYVAPEVAKLLLDQETDPMKLGRIEQVTIFFADIRSFTSLVQHLPLTELRLFLNDFFNIFTDVIFEKQGTVDKFMGDAVLAFFGAPLANKRANQHAVEAAQLVLARFERLKDRWSKDNDVFTALDLGIGITCGAVFLGNVGSAKRFDYTVIGNEVNIAQRLAAESRQCSIFITEKVRKGLKEGNSFEYVGPVRLRGITSPVVVYSVPSL